MYNGKIGYQLKATFDQRCDCTLRSVMGEYNAVSGAPDSNYISIISTAGSYSKQSPLIRIDSIVPSRIFEGFSKQRIHTDPFSSHMLMF